MAITTVQGSRLKVQGSRRGQESSSLEPGTSNLERRSARGQTSLDYAALMMIVIASVVGMSVYTQRAISGKWRSVGDTFGYGRQYEPSPQPLPPPLRTVSEWEGNSEGTWRGTWTPIGPNQYRAHWDRLTGTGAPTVDATLIVTFISGDEMLIERSGSTDGNDCSYRGTISGMTVTGTYLCDLNCGEAENRRARNWEAGCEWRGTLS